jgi:AraC-like DNA-binding protein
MASAVDGDESAGASRELVDFVATNAVITTYPGSRQAQDDDYRLAPRILSHYDCIFIRRGQMIWTIGGQAVPAGPMDLLLLPPSVRHSARSTRTPMLFTSIHFQATLPGGQDVFELLGAPLQRSVIRGSRLDAYLAGATAEWDRVRDDLRTDLLMPGWAHLIVLELLHDDAATGRLLPRPVGPVVRAALELITQRVTERVPPADLARELGVSPQHLNRLFRRTLGVTALQYSTQLKMTRASALLDQTDLTVRAIARHLGYDDPYHFSRVFTRHHGVSPARWRAQRGQPPV